MHDEPIQRPSSPGTPLKLGAIGGKEPCPCGSGKKYKACCYRKDLESGVAQTPTAPKASRDPEVSDGQDPQEGDPVGEGPGEPGDPHTDARSAGRPKVPVQGKRSSLPPRNPPQGGAAKALNRRSGHR